MIPAADKASNGHYVTLANNYFTMIRGTAVEPKAQSWDDLLDPHFKQKLQYSTPARPATARRCSCCCGT